MSIAIWNMQAQIKRKGAINVTCTYEENQKRWQEWVNYEYLEVATMTEQEKMLKHIDKSMEILNDLYNDYKMAVEHGLEQVAILDSLSIGAIWLGRDFNELKSMGVLNEQPKTNDTEIR